MCTRLIIYNPFCFITNIMSMPTTKRKAPKYSISDREVMNLILLTNIVSKLEVQRANNNSILPYGAVKEIAEKRQVILPWLTNEKVYYMIHKLNSKDAIVTYNTGSYGGSSTTQDNSNCFPSALSTLAITSKYRYVRTTWKTCVLLIL